MPSDDLEASLRRIVVQQQLMDERLRTLERSRLLRAWNVLYRKATAWRGGLPDLRTSGDVERLLSAEEQRPAPLDSNIRFSVSIEGGTEAERKVSLASLEAQSYRNWDASAKGDYILTLHAGDRLAPHALYFYAQALASSNACAAYADELCSGTPLLKPGWSPELLRSANYLGRALVRRPDSSFESAVHIPQILYHRASPAIIERTAPKYAVPAGSKLSVIICSREPRRVRECVDALRRNTTETALEIIVVHHMEGGSRGKMPEQSISYEGPFDFARMNNLAAQKATSPALLFLNDDVVIEHRGWDRAFMSTLSRPDIGAVGAILDCPDGTIQHAGVVIGMGDGAGHCGRFQTSSELWPWLRMSREVSAVTGAMLGMRTGVFRHLNGFDELFPINYNDVDLCLRIRQAGLSIVCLDAGKIVHRESQTRVGGTTYNERDDLYKRWAHVLTRPDEFYSPHLELTERIALRTAKSPLLGLVATR